MLTLVVGLCTLLCKEVFYLLQHSLIANRKQEVGVISEEGALRKRSTMLAHLLVMRLPRLVFVEQINELFLYLTEL